MSMVKGRRKTLACFLTIVLGIGLLPIPQAIADEVGGGIQGQDPLPGFTAPESPPGGAEQSGDETEPGGRAASGARATDDVASAARVSGAEASSEAETSDGGVSPSSAPITDWAGLQQAVERATGDVVIEIGNDIDFEGSLDISHGYTITLVSDGGTHVLSQSSAQRHVRVTSGTLVLENVTLDGIDSLQTGGGVAVAGADAALVVTTGATIRNCKGNIDGGAVSARGGSVEIDGGSLIDNRARMGGAIDAGLGTKVMLYDGLISGNTTTHSGGGISVMGDSASLVMAGGIVTDNKATDPNYPAAHYDDPQVGYGGGIAVSGGADFTLDGGLIDGNESHYSGGGVFLGTFSNSDLSDTSTFTMNAGSITNNLSRYAAGGIIVRGIDATFDFIDGAIDDNRAEKYVYTDEAPQGGHGGGVYLMCGTLNMGDPSGNGASDPTLMNNWSENQGGAAYMFSYAYAGIQDNSVFNLYSGRIDDNASDNMAGGLQLYSSTFNMFGGSLDDNTATFVGGAAAVMDVAAARVSEFNMFGGSVSGNRATDADARGGALYLNGISASNKAVFVCDGGLLDGNRAGFSGGAVYASANATVDLDGATVVSNNTAGGEGGGIYSAAYTGFVSGTAAGDYTGVTDADYANLTLADTVSFKGNAADTAYEAPAFAAAMTHLGFASSSIPDGSGGYVHPLNNFDINFGGTTALITLDVARLYGIDRYETSREVSIYGRDAAAEDAIILASGDDYHFADSLTASSLSKHMGNVPIVLTPTEFLSEKARQVIADDLQVSHVIIVGDECAVSADTEASVRALPGVTNLERIGGIDRQETAELIYQRLGGMHYKTAVIARCSDFPDSLTISPWAAATESPIFLTEFGLETLTDETKAALSSGGFERIIVLGDENAVPASAYRQAQTAAGLADAQMIRIGGSDRYETSSMVAEWVTAAERPAVEQLTWNSPAFARGDKHSDSLTGGALQGRDRSVILLTPTEEPSIFAMPLIRVSDGTIRELRFFGDEHSITHDTTRSFINALTFDFVNWKPYEHVRIDL